MSSDAIAMQTAEAGGRPWVATLHEWVTTVDHKRLGVLYILYALFFLVIGGIVYQDIQASQFLDRLLEHRFNAFQVRHIAAQPYGADPEAGQIDNGMLGFTAGPQEGDGNVRSGLR